MPLHTDPDLHAIDHEAVAHRFLTHRPVTGPPFYVNADHDGKNWVTVAGLMPHNACDTLYRLQSDANSTIVDVRAGEASNECRVCFRTHAGAMRAMKLHGAVFKEIGVKIAVTKFHVAAQRRVAEEGRS